jgi:ZU5 domain-containing protein
MACVLHRDVHSSENPSAFTRSLMQRVPRRCLLVATCALLVALSSTHPAAQRPDDAEVSVVAVANDSPVGAGHESAIIVTASTLGATLEHITIQVRDGSRKVVQVIEAEGHARPQVAISAPAVFQNQQLRVHAQVRPPQALDDRVVNAFVDATVAATRTGTVVDASGGVVTVPGGGTMTIPVGALAGPTTLEVRISTTSRADGVTPLSPMYEFLPDGLLFARPVTVTLPVPAGTTSASVYWSRLGAPGFDAIGGTIDGDTVTAETVHFSRGIVGQPSSRRTVTGVGQTTWISASTRVNEPMDFSTQTIEALVTDAHGDVTAVCAGIGGTGAALGTFTIPNVPNGEYILRAGQNYVVTRSNSPDLGRFRGGRPLGERIPLGQPAFLTIDVSNLAGWQGNDQLEFFSTEANDWEFGAEAWGVPAAGATATTVHMNLSQIGFSEEPPSAIQGTNGDAAFLTQLSSATSPTGVRYQAISRVSSLPTFDLTSGGSVTVAATMLDVAQTNTIAVDYRGSQFLQMLQENPNRSGVVKGYFGVFAQPGTAADGFYSANADLLLVFHPDVDIATGTISHGSPADANLAGNWGTLFAVAVSEQVRLRPLGTIDFPSGVFADSLGWTTTPEAAQAAPIIPPLSLATAITVNGADYYAGGTGVGTALTLSWLPGVVGHPAFYRITISRLFVNAQGRTGKQTIANILTPNTTLKLPPGIVQSGSTYVFQLMSVASTSINAATLLATSPFKSGLDIATATTVSGEFVP